MRYYVYRQGKYVMEISDRRRRTSYRPQQQQRKREREQRERRGENNELAIDKQSEAIAVTVYIKNTTMV